MLFTPDAPPALCITLPGCTFGCYDPGAHIPRSRRTSHLAKSDLLSRRAAAEKEGESGTYLSRAAAFYFYGSAPFTPSVRIDFEEKYFSYSVRITANNASDNDGQKIFLAKKKNSTKSIENKYFSMKGMDLIAKY